MEMSSALFEPVLDTTDIEAARDSVGRAYVPHLIRPRDAGNGFHGLHLSRQLGAVAVDRISYGSDVQVIPETNLGQQYCVTHAASS